MEQHQIDRPPPVRRRRGPPVVLLPILGRVSQNHFRERVGSGPICIEIHNPTIDGLHLDGSSRGGEGDRGDALVNMERIANIADPADAASSATVCAAPTLFRPKKEPQSSEGSTELVALHHSDSRVRGEVHVSDAPLNALGV
jgi:hypothetical protein